MPGAARAKCSEPARVIADRTSAKPWRAYDSGISDVAHRFFCGRWLRYPRPFFGYNSRRIEARMLNYNHLNYFHVAATEGTVAAAAERLGVTQPTVSEQIKALERSLGVTLFERTPSGLRLTEAGRLVFEQTSVMFLAGERLVEALGQSSSDLPRTLRVGIGSAVARTTTSDFIMPLLAIERCVPSIRSADSVELLRELKSNELDLVLSETEPAEAAQQGINVTLLDRVSLVAVAPPAVEPAADWQNVGLVHYRASSAYRWDVETFLDDAPSAAADRGRGRRCAVSARSRCPRRVPRVRIAIDRTRCRECRPFEDRRRDREFATRSACDLSGRCGCGAGASSGRCPDRSRASVACGLTGRTFSIDRQRFRELLFPTCEHSLREPPCSPSLRIAPLGLLTRPRSQGCRNRSTMLVPTRRK